jgi:hypothetical protein
MSEVAQATVGGVPGVEEIRAHFPALERMHAGQPV